MAVTPGSLSAGMVYLLQSSFTVCQLYMLWLFIHPYFLDPATLILLLSLDNHFTQQHFFVETSRRLLTQLIIIKQNMEEEIINNLKC